MRTIRLFLAGIVFMAMGISGCQPAEATATPTPTATQTPLPTNTATTTPEPTATPLPPLPAELLSQLNGTSYSFESGGLVYTAPGGEKIKVPGNFDATGFKVTLATGETVNIPAEQIKDRLNVLKLGADKYLTLKDDNGAEDWFLAEKNWVSIATPLDTLNYPDKYTAVVNDPTHASEADQNTYHEFSADLAIHYAETHYPAELAALEQARDNGLIFAEQFPSWVKSMISSVEGKQVVWDPGEIRIYMELLQKFVFGTTVEKRTITTNEGVVLPDLWDFGWASPKQLLSHQSDFQKLTPFGIEMQADFAPEDLNAIFSGWGTVSNSDKDTRVLSNGVFSPNTNKWLLDFSFGNLNPKYTIPAGTSCIINQDKPQAIDSDIPIGPLVVSSNVNRAVTDEFLKLIINERIIVYARTYAFNMWILAHGFSSVVCPNAYGTFITGSIMAPDADPRLKYRTYPQMPWQVVAKK